MEVSYFHRNPDLLASKIRVYSVELGRVVGTVPIVRLVYSDASGVQGYKRVLRARVHSSGRRICARGFAVK